MGISINRKFVSSFLEKKTEKYLFFVTRIVSPQGASSPDPTTVYLDLRALRNDRVTLTERGAPHSLALMESGKLLPGVNVIIANPETKGQCGDSHLGEVNYSFCYYRNLWLDVNWSWKKTR